jgi:hypothetical protein
MIDAKTFVTNHPDCTLQEGMTIGTYHYNQSEGYWERYWKTDAVQKLVRE